VFFACCIAASPSFFATARISLATASVDDPLGSAFSMRPIKNAGRAMRALYEARLEHLGAGDLVKVECPCGHSELLTATTLATAGVKPYEMILDLQPKLRCRECDARG
jgi:hypothetical protein